MRFVDSVRTTDGGLQVTTNGRTLGVSVKATGVGDQDVFEIRTTSGGAGNYGRLIATMQTTALGECVLTLHLKDRKVQVITLRRANPASASPPGPSAPPTYRTPRYRRASHAPLVRASARTARTGSSSPSRTAPTTTSAATPGSSQDFGAIAAGATSAPPRSWAWSPTRPASTTRTSGATRTPR